MSVVLKLILPFFSSIPLQIKLGYHVLQVFKYLHLFFYIFTTSLYTFSPPLNQRLHPPLIKEAVSLHEPFLDGHNDSLTIGNMLPMKAILHWTKQVSPMAQVLECMVVAEQSS
jgi:hypothetical protein